MKNIQIALPSYTGDVSLTVMSRLIHLNKPANCNVIFSFSIRVFIDKARNAMAQQCIDRGNDYLFFCDSDQIPDKDILVKMVALDKDIVGCPIPSRNGAHELAVYDLDGDRMNNFTQTQQVGAVGMASTLIKRKVLEKVIKHYPAPFQFENIWEMKNDKEILVEYSEDINFCRRARDLGFEVWCMADIKSLHIGNPLAYFYENGEYKSI